MVGVRVVQPREVPAAIRGEFGDSVAAFGDQLPQLVRGLDPTWEAARHADDRDRLGHGVLELEDAPVRLAQVARGLAQVPAKVLLVRHQPRP